MEYQNTKRDIKMLNRRRDYLRIPSSMQTQVHFHKYQATEQKLLETQQLLTIKHCPILKLEIDQNQMNDKKIEIIANTILNNDSLQNITIRKCRLRDTHLQKICEAICSQKAQTLQELEIEQMRINPKGAQAIAQVLSHNIAFHRLNLIDAGLDCESLQVLCKGLEHCMSIEYLDLRHNIFDDVGLAALIDALKENMSIKHLYLHGMRINYKEAKMLADFLEEDDCVIQELELKEAELDIVNLDLIMAAILKAGQLRRLSLAWNNLSPSICSNLSILPQRLDKFISLQLSGCDIGEDALSKLCEGFTGQTNIKILDLSWNNLSSQAMEIILDMLTQNKSLEKLLIQHNFLCVQGAEKMVQALKIHPQMRYLDISANEINSKGFMFFIELFKVNHTLENLHVRKNCIKGEEIKDFPMSLRDNSNLKYLDLKDNELENECAKNLVQLLDDNYFIEDLVVTGNLHISQSYKETINEECRKNLLIKEFLLPQLTSYAVQLPSQEEHHFKNYNVRTLHLQKQSFFRSDFIAKFINMNRHDFHRLSLQQVHFDENIKDLAEFLKTAKTKIETIVMNECDIGSTAITQMIEDCKQITTLQELRLINMRLHGHEHELLTSLHAHKNLKILDLSQNNLKNMHEIERLLVQNHVIEELHLEGNPIESLGNLRCLLNGMQRNNSVTILEYEVKVQKQRGLGARENQAQEEEDEKQTIASAVESIKQQLAYNRIIKEDLIPWQVRKRTRHSNCLDFSEHDVHGQIEPIVKLYMHERALVKKVSICMRDCKVDDNLVLRLVEQLLALDSFEIERLDLSLNHLTDEACTHLSALLTTDKKIKELNLSENIQITNEGLKEIVKCSKQNRHLHCLQFQLCSIELGRTGWQGILDDVQNNCSLTQLALDEDEVNEEFLELLKNELKQNQSIKDLIIPSIYKKKEKLKQQQQQKQKLNLLSGTGSLNIGKFDRRGSAMQAAYHGSLDIGGASTKSKRAAHPGGFKDNLLHAISEGNEDQSSVSGSDMDFDAQGRSPGTKIQTLSLRGKNLTSLDFLEKFMRENPNIVDIDLGDNPLTDGEMQKFTANIKSNLQLRTVGTEGIRLRAKTKKQLLGELDKNVQIQSLIDKNMDRVDGTRTMLNLQAQSIQNVGFLQKFLQGYQDLKVLDLTDNRLGNRGAMEITHLIAETRTIEVLNLSNNRIGPSGLQHICSALTVNESINDLDISENMVQDESLKIILAMLFRNQTLQTIKYSVTNEENIQRLQEFNEVSHLPIEEIEKQLCTHHSHAQKVSGWTKCCLPIWCWRSFIHAKHEAFRFKYDTKALRYIENELMDRLTITLYLNSLIYYVIMFVCPFVFVNECGEGLNEATHLIYAAYSVMTVLAEVAFVLRLQHKIANKNVLKFNRWHVVELLMGQIARFDTYLDVCFLSMLIQCKQWNLAAPVATLIVIYVLYPLSNLFRLMKVDQEFNHVLPKIERNCNLSFIRENMLTATVLDSFCIDNHVDLCKKQLHFGRVMGIWTLLTQDGPQYLIHLLFMFFVKTDISHSETTVVMSLIVSSIAIQISIFNVVMCSQNEFNPILLELELKKRQDKKSIREKRIQQQKELLKQRMAGYQPAKVSEQQLPGGPAINPSWFAPQHNIGKSGQRESNKRLYEIITKSNLQKKASIKKEPEEFHSHSAMIVNSLDNIEMADIEDLNINLNFKNAQDSLRVNKSLNTFQKSGPVTSKNSTNEDTNLTLGPATIISKNSNQRQVEGNQIDK